MYKAAAVSARNAKSQGQERRKRLLQSIMEAKEAQQVRGGGAGKGGKVKAKASFLEISYKR